MVFENIIVLHYSKTIKYLHLDKSASI